MSTYTLTTHVIDQLTGDRPLLKLDILRQVIAHVSDKVDRFDPEKVHQVAVRVTKVNRTITMGYSKGDTLIIMFDIQKKTIPTAFLRFQVQGMPKASQVYIDIDGTILQTK